MSLKTEKPYATIDQTCAITGLSRHYLRHGCRTNTIPHIMCGSKYMICVPALLAQLETQANCNSTPKVGESNYIT